MKKLTIIALFAALGMVSCKDTKAETTPETETTSTAADAHAGHDHSSHDGHDHSGHDHGTDVVVADGMNPPHGQPGHRCDIAVGAPLDSAPAQTSQPATTPAANQGGFLGGGDQSAAPVQATPAAQTTAPGMQGKPNPAHGQPGHRCDIQVGEPLP